MKNRITVRHGMLGDLRDYLSRTGWTIEEPVGTYEVLRARKNGYPRPLLIHNRTSSGCGYSIDERDMKVYNRWRNDRRKRGISPDWPTQEEEQRERWPLLKGEKQLEREVLIFASFRCIIGVKSRNRR